MNRLHLEVFNSVKHGRSQRITRLTGDHGVHATEIFYEFNQIIPWSDTGLLDGHVLAVLLYAASVGKPLVVHGTLSKTVLRNMEELLLAWSKWKPQRYRRIDIIPDRVVRVRKNNETESAIAAFSGGLDATFTALRHAVSLQRPTDNTRYPLRAALMVHGFDVDVYNLVDFNQLVASVRPLIDALQLDLHVMRTNSRDLRLQDWDDSSALELVGCLHMCADKFEYGLIGSTKSYDTLVLPWGSNPVTDHLMSGDDFTVIHDGAGFSRTDKAAEVMRFPLACRTLKVCYAGIDQSKNCGYCEKCLRTQMNFLAAGAATSPSCFPEELDLDRIRKMSIDHEAQMVEHASLLNQAKANNVSGDWVPILEERLTAWRPTPASRLAAQKAGAPIKRYVAKSLAFLGIDEPAKKVWRPMRRTILKAIKGISDAQQTDHLKSQIANSVLSALTPPPPSRDSSCGSGTLGLDAGVEHP